MLVLEVDIPPAVDQNASFAEEVPVPVLVLVLVRVAPHSPVVAHMHMLPG